MPARKWAHNLPMNRIAAFFTLCVGLGVSLLAQAPAVDVMPGRWTLDPAKSTYVPGPAPKSQVATLTAVANGIRTVADRVEADGSKTHFEWTGTFDGKDNPVVGDPNRDAVSGEEARRLHARDHEQESRQGHDHDSRRLRDGRPVTRRDDDGNEYGRAAGQERDGLDEELGVLGVPGVPEVPGSTGSRGSAWCRSAPRLRWLAGDSR
jgi:hypothetical protein